MKYLLALFFILLNLSVTGQDRKKNYTIATLEDKSVSLAIDNSIQYRESKKFERIILVNNKTKNTVELYNCEYKNCRLDSFDLRSINLNNKNRVVVLTLKFREDNNYGEAGAYVINKTVTEIWNIDLKERIFIAMNDYHYYADLSHYFSPEDIELMSSDHSETDYSYHYDFRITDKAEIIISGLKTSFKITESSYLKESPDRDTKYPQYCECIQPDNKQGIYKYDNGKFIKTDDR
ncbi:MAG: hypothetical protein J7604_24790 [Sporocytophaga sp.]|uniref:hypothetical protein n=1 Tax=Sporocytophaga sp. TaxID=2231183 RepID=UPI001B041791|nr:hypothetical protein [Sporocytophaga sp.]MBO9703450.1 hypothetical protein [Sporocytophaga sp.]